MRLIFIPGFGEDETIFEHLHPLLPGEKVFLSFWKDLPNAKRPELNAPVFAQELVQQYGITANDVVIGHSTGGWVALFIKQQVHCPVVQLASWTDPHKLALPPIPPRLIFFLAKRGLLFNSPLLWWSLKTRYRHQPSAPVFKSVFTRLINGNKENAVNQLRLILNPVENKATPPPDLCIHAKKDPIVHFPDGPAYEVPGDHFSLYTYPSTVAEPIVEFLKNQTRV